MADYRVLVGMNYGATDKRAEIGDIVSDLPPQSIKWLKEQDIIEPVEAAPKKGSKVEPVTAPDEMADAPEVASVPSDDASTDEGDA